MKILLSLSAVTLVILLMIQLSTTSDLDSQKSPDQDLATADESSKTSDKSKLVKEAVKHSSTENRLVLSPDHKENELLKKRAFEDKLAEVTKEFRKMNGTFNEMLDLLTKKSGLKIKIISHDTPGYSFDEDYASKNKISFDKDKKLNFDLQNMPNGEIARFLALAAGMQYLVDPDNQEVLFAEQGVILNKNFSDFSVNPDALHNLTLTEQYKQREERYSKYVANTDNDSSNNSGTPEKLLEQMKKALKIHNIKLPAGSRIDIENGQFIFHVPEEEERKILDLLANQ